MKSNKNNNIVKAGRLGAVLALLLILALSLSACSSNKAADNVSRAGGGSAAPMPAPPSAGSDYGVMVETAEAPAMAAPEEYYAYDDADYYAAEPDMSYSGEAGVDGAAGNVQSGRKITFSASLSMNTKKYDADYAAINNLIVQSGGYVASERTSDYTSYGYNEGRSSYFSARIPADGYDSFIDKLSGIGEVTDKNKWSEDLTSQYFDTEARIEMLELRKERLMGYLVEAEDAADIVEFERELSNVLYELDSYQGYKRQLDRLVEFASIDITLTELITPETIGKDGEPLGDRASEAFSLSTYNVGQFLEGVAVFFAAAAPVLALLAVIGVIIWAIIRFTRPLRKKLREKREAREDERLEEKAQQQARRMRQAQQAYALQHQYGQPTGQAQRQAYPPQTPPLQQVAKPTAGQPVAQGQATAPQPDQPEPTADVDASKQSEAQEQQNTEPSE